MNIGDRISDYVVERVLGEGGMGAVYLARHTVLDQQVAIKILDPEVARKPGIKERFIQEANIQAKLIHPNIVRVLTATNNDGDIPALIMDYVEGKSLSEVLELRGALPVTDALKIMEQVLSAVDYAHRQGVIHRDLKPSNVMVMASGEAKVTDFGIAKVLGSTKLTRTGTAMGSAHYMSPEQIRRPETVDARSDIYSLGCVFYEVLTGRPPFGERDASGTESDYEVKTAHVTEAAPALETEKSGIPVWLKKLVMIMLEKESDNRPSSCEAILELLRFRNKVAPSQTIEELEEPYRQKPARKQKHGQIEPSKVVISYTAEKKATLIISFFIFSISSIFFFRNEKTPSDPQRAKPVTPQLDQQTADQVQRSTPPHEQTAGNITHQAEQLTLKIEKVNPNKLPSGWQKTTWLKSQHIGETKPEVSKGYVYHGLGTYTWSNGNKYVGEFKNGMLHGLGTYTWSNGNKYVGQFKNDKMHGSATYKYTEGAQYVGEFMGNKRDGLGTFICASGEKYVGKFKNGFLQGQAIKYRSDGSIEESGFYDSDKLVKSEHSEPTSFSRSDTGPRCKGTVIPGSQHLITPLTTSDFGDQRDF